MIRRFSAVVLAAALALLAAAGCEPQRARGPTWVNPLDVAEARLLPDPKDINYSLCRMEFGRVAIMLGCPLRAKPRLMEAFEQLDVQHDATGAALSSERFKFYKGESYERAMLGVYLGLAEYQAGRFNEARIFFTRALSADRTAVIKDSTPPEVGDDFGLAYYWLGKAYARLGDADNTAIAFRKAAAPAARKNTDVARERSQDAKAAADCAKQRAEGEKWTYETFANPKKPELRVEGLVAVPGAGPNLSAAPPSLPGAADASPVLRATDKAGEFFTAAFQAEANAVLAIEVGRCPFKYLGGISGERTEFGRSCVRPHHVRVYVDGHAAGPAFPVLDLWDQAATQDRIGEKDAAQAGKAVTREILRRMPYVGGVAGYWDVTGDVRHWTTLPGKVYLFAGKVAPGLHTVRLEMYDANGNSLPRWTNTYYGLRVPESGETCVLLNPAFDGDNRLPPDKVRQALDAGADPGVACGF